MSLDIDFATLPVTDIRPGMHLRDPRAPIGNRVQQTRVTRDGRIVVIVRKRDHNPRAVSYSGAGFALIFNADASVETWDHV